MEAKTIKNSKYEIDKDLSSKQSQKSKLNSDLFEDAFNVVSPKKLSQQRIQECQNNNSRQSTLEQSNSLSNEKVDLSYDNKNELQNKREVRNKNKNEQIQKDYQIILLTNPKSGSGLAEKYLTDYPHLNSKLLSSQDKMIACTMKTYDLTNDEHRQTAIQQIEHTINDFPKSQIVVIIMGGDGSLGQIVRQFSQKELIYKNMDKIQFCLLPFGTGNDTAQVFGWGKVPGDWNENIDTLLNAVINAKVNALTVWNVHIEGEVYDSFDNPLNINDVTLCSYFNLGIDAEIGSRSVQKMKDYITQVKSKRLNKYHKVITDMQLVESNPLNMIGMNISQIYGGILQPDYWESTMDNKFIDKRAMINKSGISLHGWDWDTTTSNDEEEKHIQRYDDDKMELLGASDSFNFAIFRMSQFGQAKSPYTIEFKEDLDSEKAVYFAVDGEFYKIKKPRFIEFKVDRNMPRIKFLRFNPDYQQ